MGQERVVVDLQVWGEPGAGSDCGTWGWRQVGGGSGRGEGAGGRKVVGPSAPPPTQFC